MLQEIFRIPFLNIPVYGYGLMLVIGFLCGVKLAQFLARRSAIDPEVFSTAAVVMLISGVAGARMSHVLENWHEFTRGTLLENLKAMADIRSGGLTYYGGFILATLCSIIYARRRGIPIRRGMDIVAPCLMIGLAFGRIGCFLNGCCYGAECNLPWAVSFPYYSNAYLDEFHGIDGRQLQKAPPAELLVPTKGGGETLVPPEYVQLDPDLKSLAKGQGSNSVHPTQLYSTITGWLLAALLVAFYTLPHPPGRVFALMLILEGGTRYLLEMIRVEPRVLGPMTLSMVLGACLVVAGIIMWVITRGADDDLAFRATPIATGDTAPTV